MEKIKKISIIVVIVIMIVSIPSLVVIANITLMETELNGEIRTMEGDLSTTSNQLQQLQEELSMTEEEVEKLNAGEKYDLINPTYENVLSFISEDKTNNMDYNEDTFYCIHYASLVNNNAESQDIRCGYVVLWFEGSDIGHALVAFNITDKGMVYIEPQTDEFVENLDVGNDYWTDCVIPEPGYYYEEDPTDTIEEIVIYW